MHELSGRKSARDMLWPRGMSAVPEQVYRRWEAVCHQAPPEETAEVLRDRVRVAQERLNVAIAALRRVLAVT